MMQVPDVCSKYMCDERSAHRLQQEAVNQALFQSFPNDNIEPWGEDSFSKITSQHLSKGLGGGRLPNQIVSSIIFIMPTEAQWATVTFDGDVRERQFPLSDSLTVFFSPSNSTSLVLMLCVAFDFCLSFFKPSNVTTSVWAGSDALKDHSVFVCVCL